MANPHPKTEHLKATQFKKGERANPNGRPQNRILRAIVKNKTMKGLEVLTKDEIKTCDKWVLSMTTTQAAELVKRDDIPTYLRTLLAAVLSDMKNGRTVTIDRLRDRYIGDVKTTRIEGGVQEAVAPPITLNFTASTEEQTKIVSQIEALKYIAVDSEK
jgi:hypothetical protein|nr:MAG TPA: hypothetical protein [Caudoviricetes sp.]DAS62457.1 MAG TPA: hypothetical protein [Caudoviricetes sp.]